MRSPLPVPEERSLQIENRLSDAIAIYQTQRGVSDKIRGAALFLPISLIFATNPDPPLKKEGTSFGSKSPFLRGI
ncbi:MAG: hypothetical protein AB1589_10435 [Cyanobacteriota bacterium]